MDKRYFLGSLLAQYYFDINQHDKLTDKGFLSAQVIDQNIQISNLKNDHLLTYIVSKPKDLTSVKSIVRQKRKGKQTYFVPVRIHGRICHCYDEIWWFLLTVGYVKIEATPVNFQFTSELRLIKLDVYLKKEVMNETFDLSKFNQRAYNDHFFHRFPGQDLEETIRIDQQYFARLSLLLLFDLMNIQRTIPGLVKSDKYVKIFFAQLEKFHSLNVGAPPKKELVFKDVPRVIVTDKEYFKKSLCNSVFSNKLYQQKDFKASCVFFEDNQYRSYDDTIFQPVRKQIHIYKNVYFKKYLSLLLIEVQKFVQVSTKHVPQLLQSGYQKYCFEVFFLKSNIIYQQLCQGFHSHQPSIEKLNELRFKIQEIENLSQEQFCILNSQESTLYEDSTNPFVELITSGKAYRIQSRFLEDKISSGNLSDCEKFQEDLRQLNQVRRQQVQSVVDFCSGKLIISDDNDEKEINSFLNTEDSAIYEHPKPKKMISDLKQHQKQALTWMLYREGMIANTRDIKSQEKGDWQLSPLWEEIVLQNGQKLYLNTFTGKVTQEFQSYNSTKGGILADEMGLGKTIMTLALILQTQQKGKVTLIVVPKSVLLQWDKEIDTHSQPNSLRILTFYKMSKRDKRFRFEDYDVILTTYTVLAQNYQNWLKENGQQDPEIKSKPKKPEPEPEQSYPQIQQQQQQQQTQQLNDSFEIELDSLELYEKEDKDEFRSITDLKVTRKDLEFTKYLDDINSSDCKIIESSQRNSSRKGSKSLNLYDFYYHRVILDEAHNIKTKSTLQTRGALALKSECRWCLTGTPIQNKHDDLFSLLSFLKVETFGEYYWWNAYINKEENEEEQQYILGEIIKPIILRRTKQQLNNQNMQKIIEEICWVTLDEKERALYDKFLEGTQQLFRVYLNSDKSRGFVHIFQIINKLRMTCDHPYLALKGINLDANSIEDIKSGVDHYFKNQKSGAVDLSEKQRQQLIEMIQRGELADCPQCAEEGITIFDISVCGHVYCHNCFKEVVERYNECPTCSRKLTMKDLMSVASANNENSFEMQQIKETKWGASSKMKAVVSETKKVQKKREKCLIFTQWLEMIKLLEEKFQEEEIWCQVITGNMTIEQRNKVIQSFEQHPAFTALILSLRATSTGLNLTMANHVFLVDPWWNPAVEDQAIGRADRIGQKKQVQVIRFLCIDTIEQRINKLHEKKKRMIRKVIANEQKKIQEIDDFKFLILDS